MKISRAQAERLKKKPTSEPPKAPDADALAKAILRQLKDKPAASPYTFEFKRDGAGRIVSVSACPMGEGEAFRFDVARADNGDVAKITARPIEVKHA